MKEIEFDNNYIGREFETTKFPSLLFNYVQFKTVDSSWAIRLAASTIQIILKCFDKDGKLLGQMAQSLTPQISPYQTQPIIIFDNFPLRFDLQATFIDRREIAKYKIGIELAGIQLADDERYHIVFHLLEHTNYQIYCDSVINAKVYITEGHPAGYGNKFVTLVPVKIQTNDESFNSVAFEKHENLFVNNNIPDEQLIENFFKDNKLVCTGNRKIEKI